MSRPDTMTACIYREFGRVDVLELVDDWPYPQLKDDSVIVKMAAVSLNPKDTLLRRGKFSKTLARRPLPRGTGMDGAGQVVALGRRVDGLKLGDSVFGMTNAFHGGLMSDYARFASSELALAPNSVSIEESASIPLAALTALQALRDLCGVQSGKRVLVVGASGGVGHFAVQIAKALGANVDGACSEDNFKFVYSLGAESVFDYRDGKMFLIEQYYDAVFDASGRYHRSQFKHQLSHRGVFVSTVPTLKSLWLELLARLSLTKASRLVGVRSNYDDLALLSRWVDDEMLKPYVSQRYPLSDVALAHQHMQTGHTRGKIVIAM